MRLTLSHMLLTLSFSAPGGTVPQPVITSVLAVSTATTAAPKPTNAFAASNSNCAKWYVVQDGDYCQSVSISFSIALSDFYFLNPEINVNCTNLDLGIAYCVQAVGSISTYSGYPTTSPIYTLTSKSYVTTTSNFSTVANIATPVVTLPPAPGTLSDCVDFVEWIDVPDLAAQAAATDVSVLTDFLNDCDFALSAFNVDMSDFLSWNPSLASVSPCKLQANFSYCAWNGTSNSTSDISGSLCVVNATAYPGTISSCSCFTLIDGSTSGCMFSPFISIPSSSDHKKTYLQTV
jgi:hypothetical protein